MTERYRRMSLRDMYESFGRRREKCPFCGRVASVRRFEDKDGEELLYIHNAAIIKRTSGTNIKITEFCSHVVAERRD